MKKSRIIIPALSLIAFSVAASVTGAVAWFTASRTATISAGTYSVVKTGRDLSATLTAGVGTTIVGANSDTVSFDGYLTDGSFDHKDKVITYPNSSGTQLGGTVNLAEATTTNLKRANSSDNNKPIYTAVTFDISFSIKFGDNPGDIGLFIDNGSNKTSFTVDGGADAATAKGFRMAIVPKTAAPTGSLSRATVIADLQDDTLCKYIAETTDTNLGGVSYEATDYDLIDVDYNTALPADKALEKANALKRADYLGFFKHASGTTVTIPYTVVAWFEGTDPEIVNRTAPELYQSVVAKLCFEAIELAD